MDKDIAGLALATPDVTASAALPLTVPLTLPLTLPAALVLAADVLEFDAMDDDDELEESKDGGAIASEGLTSAPVPQGIAEPSG